MTYFSVNKINVLIGKHLLMEIKIEKRPNRNIRNLKANLLDFNCTNLKVTGDLKILLNLNLDMLTNCEKILSDKHRSQIITYMTNDNLTDAW